VIDRDFEKRLAELVDGDVWTLADELAERYPADEYDGDAAGRNGLHAELLDYSNALREDYGIKLGVQTMRKCRATALAWGRGTRAPCAPYKVHELLRSVSGREQLINKLVKRNGGRLTVADVQRWREDNHPKPLVSWEDRFDRQIRRALKQADPRSVEARELLIGKLQTLIRELGVA
jgi:hypothetical protein